jgi:hypothetical protein
MSAVASRGKRRRSVGALRPRKNFIPPKCGRCISPRAIMTITSCALRRSSIQSLCLEYGYCGLNWLIRSYPAANSTPGSGVLVIIDGKCLSACSMIIGTVPRDRICVTPNAVLGFYAAFRRTETGAHLCDRCHEIHDGCLPPGGSQMEQAVRWSDQADEFLVGERASGVPLLLSYGNRCRWIGGLSALRLLSQ